MNLAGLAEITRTLRGAVQPQPAADVASSSARLAATTPPAQENDVAARVAARRASLQDSRFNALAAGAKTFGTPERDVAVSSPQLRAPQTPKAEALAGQKAASMAV